MLSKLTVLFVILLNIQNGVSKSTPKSAPGLPVDLNNPVVQRLAHETVDVYNKQHNTSLKFHQLLSAYSFGSVVGSFYKLNVEVFSDKKAIHFYQIIDKVVVGATGKALHDIISISERLNPPK
ncbi:unnamed protein product [Bursaphelenchus xylophilus]|uniref:(pine wood nematode) hypothetical protein n=1 Tax=Bursaphelenchus xylophilus TaxID=6326 RepID=A0A1I7SQI6_BURXY|nr:unnamed protein product [Bursaphelenchus xylophilus]CAG9109950.1 unnamed protein product [Bursaphelenchus xylophilus]